MSKLVPQMSLQEAMLSFAINDSPFKVQLLAYSHDLMESECQTMGHQVALNLTYHDLDVYLLHQIIKLTVQSSIVFYIRNGTM